MINDNIFPTNWYRNNASYVRCYNEQLYLDNGSGWSTYYAETDEYLCLDNNIYVEYDLYYFICDFLM